MEYNISNPIKPKNNKMQDSKNESLDKLNEKDTILFTFGDFKVTPIKIDREFNNHFKDEKDYIDRIGSVFEFFTTVSNYKKEDFIGNRTMQRQFHFHPIEKSDTIKSILEEYGFNSRKIEEIISGQRLYQLSLEAKRSSVRIVVEWTENIFSPLFIDTNHHIYINEKITKDEKTLTYDYCPIHKKDQCNIMKYADECYAFTYLDEDKLQKSFGFNYSPNDDQKTG